MIREYIRGKSVKLSENFYSHEFDCKGKKCQCRRTRIDDQLIVIVQAIRDEFGVVTITSGYRCSSHNAAVGGASMSYHVRGRAADIVCEGVDPLTVAQFAESIGVNGIGLYNTKEDGFFVHVDTRAKKSFWRGKKETKISTFGSYETKKKEVDNVKTSITQEEFNQMMNKWLAERAAKEPNEWSKKEREWAEFENIILGDHVGFSYESFCTREQMVVFLYRLYCLLTK